MHELGWWNFKWSSKRAWLFFTPIPWAIIFCWFLLRRSFFYHFLVLKRVWTVFLLEFLVFDWSLICGTFLKFAVKFFCYSWFWILFRLNNLKFENKVLALLTVSSFVCRTFVKFENDVAVREAQMHQWQTNMAIMDSKERQYMLQHSNYKVR